MTSSSNRGRSAEDKVRESLNEYSGWSSFAFYRLPDAHAGSMKETLADFMVMHKSQHSLLEVKEVNHDFRLPHKNFDTLKVARMRAWHMAGSAGHVLVHFVPLKLWRYAPIDYFVNREGGSWDMRDKAATSLEQQMMTIYGMPPVKRMQHAISSNQ